MKEKEKNYNYTGYNTVNLDKSRDLRRKMTKEERRLWYVFLRKYPVKIYKQRSIDRYIADFYCSKARLIIELDGSQHYTEEGMAYDDFRTEILERYGLKVIRFSNMEINTNFEGVCEVIDAEIKSRIINLSVTVANAPVPPPLACPLGYSGEARVELFRKFR